MQSLEKHQNANLGWVAPQVQLLGRLTVEWVNFMEIAYGIYIFNYNKRINYKVEI